MTLLATALLGWLWLGSGPVADRVPSPAEREIARARLAVERHGGRPEPWADLAMAHARRARETADPAHYDRAADAVSRSLEIAPGNFAARRAWTWILLGRHRFGEALEEARRLNREAPDDVLVYGFLVDAHVQLGNYAAAEEAAQWMLDLRPGNVAGLTRAAYLRELFGDLEGAFELMASAYHRILPNQVEDRAWVLVHTARLERMLGELDAAEALLDEALDLFPEYHYALAELARVREARGDRAGATELFARHYRQAPHPENLYELARALRHAGRTDEAREAFARFEREARAEMNGRDNANRELIFFYADEAGRPDEALRIAESEIARRRDVHTLDAYAWALFRNGREQEARRAMRAVLEVGVRDPSVLEHARSMGTKPD